jgi:hypothetical protein
MGYVGPVNSEHAGSVLLPAEAFEIRRPNAEQIPPVSWQSIKDNFVGGYGVVFLYNYT